MDDEDKRRKQDSRRDKAIARMAKENPYIKEMIDDTAGRPEEVCYTSISNLSCMPSIFMLNNLLHFTVEGNSG
jgi:hypothetical protein